LPEPEPEFSEAFTATAAALRTPLRGLRIVTVSVWMKRQAPLRGCMSGEHFGV